MVHVREIDGKPLRFGHSGWLWFNAYLLYDEGTESLWHHYDGVAMSGALRGKRMRSLPTTLPTFGAWRREHPGTLVLRKPDPAQGRPPTDVDTYATRNAQMRWGFGFEAAGRARWVAFASIPASGVLEDEADGVPFAVVRDPGGRSALAWDRRVGGSVLSFDVDTSVPGADGRPCLRERGGRRAWFLRTGVPVPGTGADARLAGLPGSLWEASAWALQHPAGDVRRPPPR